VVQGDRDPFGTPAEVRAAVGDEPPTTFVLREVRAAHSPARDPGAVRDLVRDFLAGLGGPGPDTGAPFTASGGAES
jgi:hypothetical protein